MKSCFSTAILLFVGLLVLTVDAFSNSSSTFNHCKSPINFANPSLLENVQRGFNLPSWDAEEQVRHPSDVALSNLLQAGIKHIRLPIEPEKIVDAEHSSKYIVSVLTSLHKFITKGFVVSIDMHPGADVSDLYAANPQQALGYLRSAWKILAPRLEEFSADQITLELLNEPPTKQSVWWAHAESLLQTVRELRPDITVIISAADFGRIEPLVASKPFTDNNVIYAFHYYDPFAFTHQGAPWHPEDDPIRQIKGLPFPASLNDQKVQEKLQDFERNGRTDLAAKIRDMFADPWTDRLITDAFQIAADWAEHHDVPLIVNEFGVLKFFAPKESRMHWIKAIINSSAINCIGWTHWDYADGFGFIDEETGLPEPDFLKLMKKN